MRVPQNYTVSVGVFLPGLIGIGLGWMMASNVLVVGGLLGVGCAIAWQVVSNRRGKRTVAGSAPSATAPRPAASKASHAPVDSDDTDGLVGQMLAQGRFALLMRPQIASGLSESHFAGALAALEEAMALVPDGEVVLGNLDDALDDGRLDDNEIASHHGHVVAVAPFFLDRYPITNQQYFEFVAAGGYGEMALWDQTIWTAVLDFVDSTGMPGPYYWKDGSFLPGEENHPVVGVSWFEANAFARWSGKRLSTDAEWVKAGSWPVPISPTSRMQRKFPWGDTIDRACANLWGTRLGRIAPVDQFAEGVSVGGVYQLIGNVWEWTSGNLRIGDHPNGELTLPTPMKSIRGGAFDTYFDNQATCQFQSGENPLHRRHNIGFRCALGVCDVTLTHTPGAPAESTSDRTPEGASERAPERTVDETEITDGGADDQAPATAEEVHA